jgi:hypothetical protein
LIESWAPVLGALVGAIIGSLGSAWLTGRIEKAKERRHIEQELVERYLFQLQSALEALWFRIDNVIHRGGRRIMAPDYYLASTLYALGSLFAHKHCLLLHGVYAQLEGIKPGVGRELRYRLERLEKEMERAAKAYGVNWHRYDRLTLADLIIRAGDAGCQLSSYGEFRAKLASERTALDGSIRPAEEFINKLEGFSAERLLTYLREIGEGCAANTGIPLPSSRATEILEPDSRRGLQPKGNFNTFRGVMLPSG